MIPMATKRVHGLDPGSAQSAFITWNGTAHSNGAILDNETLIDLLRTEDLRGQIVGIEQVRSYGMKVGNETFDTCEWSGRFAEAATRSGAIVRMIPRKLVVIHLCGHVRTGGDAPVNATMKARFGDAMRGVTSHLYAALGVADYVLSLK